MTIVYGTLMVAPDFAIVLLNTSSVSVDDFLFDTSITSGTSAFSPANGDYYFA